jgi:hypothetical protein
MRARWPSCRAPIVGTRAIEAPERRQRSLHARTAPGVVNESMSVRAPVPIVPQHPQLWFRVVDGVAVHVDDPGGS